MQSESIAKLAEALAKAQGMMKPAGKGKENPYFKSNYADLPAVWEAAREALSKNGLSVIQTTDYDSGDSFVVTTLAHSTGEWISGRYKIKPVKDDPQGFGSAVTYARRYAFCAIVGVTAEDEDDDGNAASNKKETATARNKRYAALKADIMASNDPAGLWHDRKEEIDEFRLSLGEEYYQQLVAAGAKRRAELEEQEASFPQGFNDGGK